MKLKPDKVLRDRFFTPESYQHPAKGHLGLWWEILERYTKAGEWVLDPMAGVGATMLGALMGRNIICVELEQHFIEPMRASWARMRQNPMLGYELGQVMILRGDARALPLSRVDSCVFSPPWEDVMANQDDWKGKHAAETAAAFRANHPNYKSPPGNKRPSYWAAEGKGYTRPVDAILTSPPYEGSDVSAGNVGNRIREETWGKGRTLAPDSGYTRPVDSIITSPPYESALDGHGSGITLDGTKSPDWHPGPNSQVKRHQGYTRPVDAVVTSPPYGEALTGGGIAAASEGRGNYKVTTAMPGSVYSPQRQSQAAENIGNLRGPAYWEAMTAVYQECHRVLKLGGLMVLVLKGFTRDGKYIDLPGQTRALCETLGYRFVEEWQRELWSLSFWRILQGSEKKALKMGLQMGLTEEDITEVIRTYRVSNGKLDERLLFETVLVLRKAESSRRREEE